MKLFLIILISIVPLLAVGQTSKYGALAIDRSNGMYFGWAVDYNSQSEADARAQKECRDRGGNCTIVKRFVSGWCATYRTIDGNVGIAYGWGIARTRNESDRIATSECEKRSNGNPCNNYVWGCNSQQNNENDSFWDGDEIEENNNESSDFWSGGAKEEESQNDNKETDFWSGMGTTAEEQRLIENTKPDESNQFIGNVRSRTQRIRIFCVDTGEEDGDLVRIINNGTVLKEEIYLTNSGRSYWFDLKFGQNNIEILALNQGDVGANTAAFKVYDDKGNLLAEKGWHLKTGYQGKLLILKL